MRVLTNFVAVMIMASPVLLSCSCGDDPVPQTSPIAGEWSGSGGYRANYGWVHTNYVGDPLMPQGIQDTSMELVINNNGTFTWDSNLTSMAQCSPCTCTGNGAFFSGTRSDEGTWTYTNNTLTLEFTKDPGVFTTSCGDVPPYSFVGQEDEYEVVLSGSSMTLTLKKVAGNAAQFETVYTLSK